MSKQEEPDPELISVEEWTEQLPSLQPVPEYPRVFYIIMKLLAVLHDLLIGTVGVALHFVPTVAITTSLGKFATVLDGLLVIGALLGIIGNVTERQAVQITGSVSMAAALATWAVAIVSTTHTAGALAVAGVFFAGTIGISWRIFGVIVNLFVRPVKKT